MNILDLEYTELEKIIKDAGLPGFRAGQLFSWAQKGVTEPEEMTNVPKSLWEKPGLEELKVELPKVLRIQRSYDGTVKGLLELEDGNAVESVFMKYKYGNSICISSQA